MLPHYQIKNKSCVHCPPSAPMAQNFGYALCARGRHAGWLVLTVWVLAARLCKPTAGRRLG